MRLVTLVALLLLAFAAPASAAGRPPTLADLEDEVMCVECGTPLIVSQSPVANQERSFINEQIAAGKDKQQIKAALVAEYGEQVLAEPKGGGFDSTLWIVPVVIVLLGAAGIFFAVRRWRRNGPEPRAPLAPALSAEDARRLDAELGR
ncbi:cytochrome c-type biogenesis protein [Candidatus Solirubrobacter pratensis]|jgi:cytochrome c-type biogenesis protein CcmH|uniref:cytochrome c-type biogenesis protein n=1 Tax=Candidatus Solirubrobacter pratensis TaxID=1298857 RepID=UPI00040AEB50|nr:cytochrome c-type biogenesis protein [Candidatus Solirubrobacter pratensis]